MRYIPTRFGRGLWQIPSWQSPYAHGNDLLYSMAVHSRGLGHHHSVHAFLSVGKVFGESDAAVLVVVIRVFFFGVVISIQS